MRRSLASSGLLLFLAACGGHPLDGGFHEVTADGSAGRQLTFDRDSNRLELHTAPRADGTHEHVGGTYRLDGTQLEVEWSDAGKVVALRGSIEGDELVLSGAGVERLVLHRGAAGHGH